MRDWPNQVGDLPAVARGFAADAGKGAQGHHAPDPIATVAGRPVDRSPHRGEAERRSFLNATERAVSDSPFAQPCRPSAELLRVSVGASACAVVDCFSTYTLARGCRSVNTLAPANFWDLGSTVTGEISPALPSHSRRPGPWRLIGAARSAPPAPRRRWSARTGASPPRSRPGSLRRRRS